METLVHPPLDTAASTSIACAVEPVLDALFFDPPPVTFEFWDGSVIGDGTVGSTAVPKSGGLAPHRVVTRRARCRAGLCCGRRRGDRQRRGPARTLKSRLRGRSASALSATPDALRAIRALGGFGRRPPVPAEELVPRGIRHSRDRDPRVDQSPLRRRQQVLRAGVRLSDDVLVRAVRRRRHHARRGTGCKTRTDLSQARTRRPTGITQRPGPEAAARHRVRLGVDGDPRASRTMATSSA